MPENPCLIFAEEHDDSITESILAKLQPHLKALGYDTFIDETPPGCVKGLEQSLEKAYQRTQKYIENYVCENQAFDFLGHETATTLALRDLLRSLLENKITYQGGDHWYAWHTIGWLMKPKVQAISRCLMNASIYMQIVYAVTKTLGPIRDYALSHHYLDNFTQHHAFSARIGLAHVDGIQANIIKNMSIDQAKNAFNFYYLYSMPAQREKEALIADYEPNKAERIRAGITQYPLGLNVIDATKLSQDEIVKRIIKDITEKQPQLSPSKASALPSLKSIKSFTLLGNTNDKSTLADETCENEIRNYACLSV